MKTLLCYPYHIASKRGSFGGSLKAQGQNIDHNPTLLFTYSRGVEQSTSSLRNVVEGNPLNLAVTSEMVDQYTERKKITSVRGLVHVSNSYCVYGIENL